MFRQVGPWEIILVLAVLLLLFGAKKLPELARSVGRSVKELRSGMKEGEEAEAGEEAGAEAEAPSEETTPEG
jgi:sec-independent protein translocase protein TatA